VPKDEAAAWALERLSPGARPWLALARDAYLGVADDPWTDRASIKACADELFAAIRTCAARPDPGRPGLPMGS
jgi:hypothetical protein